MTSRLTLLALAVLTLAACSGPKKFKGDDQPTLAALGTREITVTPDNLPRLAEEQTIAAYRQFLQAAPGAPQRAEAMRRLGDLEMDRADRIAAEGAGVEPDYKAAIARYAEFLKAYPKDPRNDRVLYQLARAQEQGGDLEGALKTLSRLVADHPGAPHTEEAQFRRGELLFTMRDYKAAEAAYAAVLGDQSSSVARLATQGEWSGEGPPVIQRSPYRERALYMQGWALFKQARLDEALQPFFAVLDLKLGQLGLQARDEADLAALKDLKRADREMVEDTFRVVSISLSNLQGAETISRYITSPVREGYQFRVYQQLGELYIKQGRIKDAADTFALFVRRQPLHAQAPLLQARVVEIYEKSGFDTLALQAKKDHVLQYGADSELRRANASGWQRAQPLVKTHLSELAQHHHALAQTSKTPADVQEAARWYRTLLTSFPTDAQAPGQRFLLAELLFEDRRWADAAAEYETVAYRHLQHPRAADAGYAALLSYAAQDRDLADAAARKALQGESVASALRFAQAFPADARGAAVLTRAAEQIFALGDVERAATVARQALALQPPPAPELRRTAWTVIAHQAFEKAEFADAERAYGEVLVLTPDRSPGRGEVAERLAAAIYRQGEAARTGGDARAAVGHFERVAALGASGVLSVTSAVRASAQVDAAAALIGLKDWDKAAGALEDFRRQQPGHPLQAEVAPKLALAYLELGRSSQAAAEFERVAAASADPEFARGALWQAAELHEKAARAASKAAPAPAPMVHAARSVTRLATRKPAAVAPAAPAAPPPASTSPLMAAALQGYERYLQRYPQPLEFAVEARWRLAELTRLDGQAAKAATWLQAVRQADLAAGGERTARTRTLGGQATLALAEPVLAEYRKVQLIEPLAQQLKLKKAKMEEALRAYAAASEVAIADVTTAATFHTAALYQDFGQALITSTRPKKLNKIELEQYNVMLEEQAFPFEEKAIELHEANTRRTAAGVYDLWIERSFTELAKFKPVRYGKTERGDAALPQDVAALEAALNTSPGQVALLNQLGIAQRQRGRFDKAREAYEAAIALEPTAAQPTLNLAILFDLYLGDSARAMALYQRCQELSPADATLGKWVAELKARKPAPQAPNVAHTNTSAATTTAAGTASTATAARKEPP